MINPIKKYVILVFAIILFIGCQKEIEYDNNNLNGTIKISASDNVKSRGLENDMDQTKTSSFGFFAYSTKENWTNTATSQLLHNEKAFFLNNQWSYTNIKKWPKDSLVSIFAYSPYMNDKTIIQKNPFIGAPVINFTVNTDDVANMVDLLTDSRTINRNLKETSNNGTINFEFSHVLTSIVLFGKSQNELPPNTKLYITKVELIAADSILYKKGKYHFDNDSWLDLSSPYKTLDMTGILNLQNNTYGNKYINQQSIEITGDNQEVALFKDRQAIHILPAYCIVNGIRKNGLLKKGDAKLKISYTIAVKDLVPTTKEAELDLDGYTSDNKLGNLEKGKKHKYTICFNIKSDVISLKLINVEDWGDLEPENIVLK